MQHKNKAFLFGPFIGTPFWEFFRFAPYAIHLKKTNPDINLIILTRSSRFDFYGKYADILIPEKVNEDYEDNDCFKSSNISMSNYYKLKTSFYNSYKNRFDIVNHFYPNIKYFKYKLKWQFPRDSMNYNFDVRNKNKEILNKFNDSTSLNLVDFSWVDDIEYKQYLFDELKGIDYIDYEDFLNFLPVNINDNTFSHYGSLMLLIKKMKLVIGNIDNSNVMKLALLLKTPTITINETLTKDAISLINPFNTSIKFYKKDKNENNL